MAGKTLSFFLKLNDKDFQSGLKKSTRSLQKFGSNMQRLGDDLTRNVSLPILAIGAGAVKMASDLEETDSKFRTVFSSLEEQAVNTAKAFQKEFGLAEETTKNLDRDNHLFEDYWKRECREHPTNQHCLVYCD